ncbi:hypothetical protein GW17_00014188 [Ensete ventricosum]|nr:hypothetical protein GW17_00014188 [Ensete ventricosum]
MQLSSDERATTESALVALLSLDKCIDIDADGRGYRDVYSEYGGHLTVNPLGRSLDSKLRVLEFLPLPSLRQFRHGHEKGEMRGS